MTAVEFIDAILVLTAEREMFPGREVQDILLDLRNIIVGSDPRAQLQDLGDRLAALKESKED